MRPRLITPYTNIVVITGPPADVPTDQAAAFRQRGNRALSLNREDEALVAFQRAIALNPRDRLSLIALGRLNLKLGRFQDAVPALQQAASLLPGEAGNVARDLALAHVGRSDETSAARVLREAGFEESRIGIEIAKLRIEANRHRQR